MPEDISRATLIDLLNRGIADAPAIRIPYGPTISYENLRQQVKSFAEKLLSAGISRNDRIAIVLPNGIESIIAFLASSYVATAAPLNPSYKQDEFRFYLEDTNARVILMPPEGADDARAAADESPDIRQLTVGIASDGLVEIVNNLPTNSQEILSSPKPTDVALMLHTSGTTGKPKRVPLTHLNLFTSATNIISTYNLTSDDVSFCVMPLFHVHGLVASTLSTLLSGGTVVVSQRFNALNFWQTADDHSTTWYSAVPSMHQSLVKRARSRGNMGPSATSRLRFIRSCSAALPSATMLDMEELFGVPVLEAYGMTEAAHQMTSNPLPPKQRVPGYVGPGTGVEVAIMNDEGVIQDSGITGAVVVRGKNVILGYEDNPEANSSSFTKGWFRTGDEGIIDTNGYLKLVGRIKELINRSGEKIAPQEIDEVLLGHPAVAEAVCFGIPHDIHGEEPSAAVVLNEPVLPSELVAHCKSRLAAFKCPRVIHIVQTIPKTATGKIQRRLVAQAIQSENEGSESSLPSGLEDNH